MLTTDTAVTIIIEARRRAWLATARALGEHLSDCFACTLEWTADCDEGQRLRAATDAAWERYEGGRP